MSIERKATRVLEHAKTLAEVVESWADFSAEIFGQTDGTVAKAFRSEIERQAFYDSVQYKEIQKILAGLMRKFGIAAGSQRKEKSGKFVVRLPRTVHQKLDIEAKREGVSLNQLATSKLSVPLSDAIELPKARDLIVDAFNRTHDGYSTDWVIVDPHHNELFIEECRRLKIPMSEYHLNHLLMNIRKTTKFKGKLNPTTRPAGFSDYDDCAFAAEIAIRTLQRTHGVTLDFVLCDPELRRLFDSTASKLVLAQTEVKLRCAALNLRKTHRLKPTDLSSENYHLVSAGPIKNISLSTISAIPGVYVFYDYTRPIFAGETENLRRRIDLHLHSGLPDWLDVNENEGFVLRFQELPLANRANRLLLLGAFINKEKPVLNYQKVG
jgi:predicted HicB family RNase H-like nuclease